MSPVQYIAVSGTYPVESRPITDCEKPIVKNIISNHLILFNNMASLGLRSLARNNIATRGLVSQARLLSSSSLVSKSNYSTPDFSNYLRPDGASDKGRAFTYFMVGSLGLLSTVGAKSTVESFLQSMSASADVLAMAKVEVKLAAIPEGKNVVVKWQGKPVFIRHRTPDEIAEANDVDISTLRDPQTDAERVKIPEWLVMVGICTHLGCVPIGEAGDFGGWFCPCHGSHYDISGRIRKGPAPLNLEIPQYEFAESETLVVG